MADQLTPSERQAIDEAFVDGGAADTDDDGEAEIETDDEGQRDRRRQRTREQAQQPADGDGGGVVLDAVGDAVGSAGAAVGDAVSNLTGGDADAVDEAQQDTSDAPTTNKDVDEAVGEANRELSGRREAAAENQPDVTQKEVDESFAKANRTVAGTREARAENQRFRERQQPNDLGDQFVPESVEEPLNQAREDVSSAAQETLSITGGFQNPTVVPTGGGLRLAGVSEEPTAAERGLADATTAPFDTAVAGVEVAETGAFAIGGTGLAGGSRQETIDRGEVIADEAQAFGERTVEAAEQNPTRFGSAIVAESALGGLAAGRLGGSRTPVTESARQTIRAGRRAGRQGSVSDFISEAEARAPRIEIVRDPDAGFIDVQGVISRGADRTLPSLPSVNTDTTLPRLRARQKLREFRTDLEFSINEARRIADERLAPTPRRGGDFAVDADVTGGRVTEGFRNLRERASDRAQGEMQGIALDIGAARRRGRQIGRRAVDRVTPEPRRGGDFAVDATITGGALSPDVDVNGRVGGAVAGAQLSAEAAARGARRRLQRGGQRLSRRLTPEPRRGGDFAVDASLFGRSVDADTDLDIQTRASGAIAGARLSAEAAGRQARQRIADGASRLERRVVPEPRRGGDFAVDADVVGGTRLADDIARFKREARFAAEGAAISADLALERVKAAARSIRNPSDIENPLAGISDTTIRVRPGRPPKQDRVLNADLFRKGDADADPVFGFDIDDDVELSDAAGRGDGPDTIEVDIDTDAGQQTVKRIQEQRTGTRTDDVSGEFDTPSQSRVGPATGPNAGQPQLAQDEATTPSVTVEADGVEREASDVGADSLGDDVGTGPALDVGPFADVDIRSDVDQRVEADQRTDTRTRPENAPDVDLRTRTRTDTDTDIRFDEDVRTDTRTRVRTETDTRRDGDIDIEFDTDRREKRRRDSAFLTDLQDNPVTSPEERIESLFGDGGELE